MSLNFSVIVQIEKPLQSNCQFVVSKHDDKNNLKGNKALRKMKQNRALPFRHIIKRLRSRVTLCYYFPSADERFDATFHTNVLVNASGYCQYIPPGILKSTCYIDVRWFPFDVQKCDLKFGSWTHSGWLLDLQMLDVDTSTYISNGEWDLVGKRV